MTPLTYLPDNRVMCPQCRVTYRVGQSRGTRAMCEVPGCKRLFQHGVSSWDRKKNPNPIRMYIDPADMEAGLA